MRLYSVFLRDHGRASDDLVLVREGFSWSAFLFTALWALWCRMWFPALGIFAALVIGGWLARSLGLGEAGESIVAIGLGVAIGYLGNDLRRWSLDRAGYQEVGIVTGRSLEDATRRFLDDADVGPDGVFPR